MRKFLTEEHKKNISKSLKGMKYKKNKRNPDMYKDIKNGMKRKEFLNKYPVSYIVYYTIKKELGINNEQDQSWFLADEWQQMEAEADEDIKAGRVTSVAPSEVKSYLRSLRKKEHCPLDNFQSDENMTRRELEK